MELPMGLLMGLRYIRDGTANTGPMAADGIAGVLCRELGRVEPRPHLDTDHGNDLNIQPQWGYQYNPDETTNTDPETSPDTSPMGLSIQIPIYSPS